MKKYYLIGVVLTMVLVFWCGSAMAEWENPMQGPEWCPDCVPVHWSQMGSFDQANNWTFNWPTTAPDGQPLQPICEWGTANPCADPQYWTPSKGMNITEARMTYRNYPDLPPYTEIAINAGLTIQYPELWMVPPNTQHNPNPEWSWMGGFLPPDGADWDNEYLQDPNRCIQDWPQYAQNGGNDCDRQPEFCHFDGPDGPMDNPNVEDGTPMCTSWNDGNPQCDYSDFANFMPCTQLGICQNVIDLWWDSFNPLMNADPDVNPGCKEQRKLFMLSESIAPLTNDRIVSVVWDKNNLPMQFRNCMTNATYEWIDYDTNWKKNIWTSRELRVQPGNSDYGPEVRFKSSEVPNLGENKFLVTYDTDQTFEISIDVDNVTPMPVVPTEIAKLQYVEAKKHNHKRKHKNKSGKAIKMREEEVVVQNITTRFLDNGALVVQWPEPDGALMGGMQLRLYIGNDTVNPDTGCFDEDFLWINSPAQVGSIVITPDIWEPFAAKTKQRDPGATSVNARFMYRTLHDLGNWRLVYMNRGYSGPFSIPLQ